MEDIDFSSYNWEGKTILLVEDDFTSKFYVDEMLEETKVKVIHAIDGKEAVELCRNKPDIDLVLLDMLLPEMDGYEAARAIREFRPELPLIAQTAYAMTNDRERCIKAGCSDYITKPINTGELLRLIDKNIRQSTVSPRVSGYIDK